MRGRGRCTRRHLRGFSRGDMWWVFSMQAVVFVWCASVTSRGCRATCSVFCQPGGACGCCRPASSNNARTARRRRRPQRQQQRRRDEIEARTIAFFAPDRRASFSVLRMRQNAPECASRMRARTGRKGHTHEHEEQQTWCHTIYVRLLPTQALPVCRESNQPRRKSPNLCVVAQQATTQACSLSFCALVTRAVPFPIGRPQVVDESFVDVAACADTLSLSSL